MARLVLVQTPAVYLLLKDPWILTPRIGFVRHCYKTYWIRKPHMIIKLNLVFRIILIFIVPDDLLQMIFYKGENGDNMKQKNNHSYWHYTLLNKHGIIANIFIRN